VSKEIFAPSNSLYTTMASDNLGYWIEVTTGLRWRRMLNERKIELDAPEKQRYKTFFKNMKSDDIVLHYLTADLVPLNWQEEKKRSIVAVSKVVSDPQIMFGRIVATCSGTTHLPKPIPLKALKNIVRKSQELKKLLRVSMRRYLTNISESDFKSIVEILPQNRRAIKKFMRSKA